MILKIEKKKDSNQNWSYRELYSLWDKIRLHCCGQEPFIELLVVFILTGTPTGMENSLINGESIKDIHFYIIKESLAGPLGKARIWQWRDTQGSLLLTVENFSWKL